MMVKSTARSKNVSRKRGQGRPVSGKNDVGRERLLAATEKLLRIMPPARVSMLRVAKEAKVDPALVRYYFGNRAALMVAVVDRVTAHGPHGAKPKGKPLVALADHICKTVQFVHSTTFMHRLMIDELAQAGTDESRARVREMNLGLVEFYRELLRSDGGQELVAADPLFLFLAVLGASDFFSSAEPLIRELLPAGTDMEKLTTRFQKFLVKLVLEGLRKR
jgi:TetR/AcrR family transcriptional regulator